MPDANRKKRKLKKPETFDFLGFTIYCSRDSKNTFFRVKVKSCNKKVANKLKKINEWIKVRRHLEVRGIIDSLNRSLSGYYNYYCVTDNLPNVQRFRFKVIALLFKWLNRRSQKKSFTWETFKTKVLERYPIVEPRVKVSLFYR